MGKFYMLLGGVALAIAWLGNLAFTPPGKGSLGFCNRSNRGTVHITLAYPGEQSRWQTQGWLTLEDGQCGTVLEGDLSNRYYYYYAETNGKYAWKGIHKFCISSEKFTFTNADKQCEGANSRWEGFFELDTGKNAENFLLNLE